MKYGFKKCVDETYGGDKTRLSEWRICFRRWSFGELPIGYQIADAIQRPLGLGDTRAAALLQFIDISVTKFLWQKYRRRVPFRRLWSWLKSKWWEVRHPKEVLEFYRWKHRRRKGQLDA